LPPFGILICWRDFFVKVTVVFMFFSAIAWFVIEQDARFLIEVFVILACFAVWGCGSWPEKPQIRARFWQESPLPCSILYGLIHDCAGESS